MLQTRRMYGLALRGGAILLDWQLQNVLFRGPSGYIDDWETRVSTKGTANFVVWQSDFG